MIAILSSTITLILSIPLIAPNDNQMPDLAKYIRAAAYNYCKEQEKSLALLKSMISMCDEAIEFDKSMLSKMNEIEKQKTIELITEMEKTRQRVIKRHEEFLREIVQIKKKYNFP